VLPLGSSLIQVGLNVVAKAKIDVLQEFVVIEVAVVSMTMIVVVVSQSRALFSPLYPSMSSSRGMVSQWMWSPRDLVLQSAEDM
jgi:hypothetical protein